ncbi:NfeD family protein [Halobacteria archaeon AArc-m2/3/4]|uniref:NfeD family protein n=1 Tax=Natronoglomus mannanivorans TaxID=2979990 RepID=A0ABT2QJG4_9EURY|nr:NfeD family protein [Halobacteria archaeon AArc-m2/3/4]
MVEFLVNNLPLTLLAVGLVLMAMEAVSPGAHLIVIGVALVGAGMIGMLFPIGGPLVLAALTLIIGAGAAWVYREFDFYGGKGTAQTSDSDSLSGRTGYVTKTVSTRGGEVKLDEGGFNPHYSARTTSGTIEEGEEIIVLDPGGGNVLTVEHLGSIEEDEIDRELARGAKQTNTDADADADSDSQPTAEETETETETEKSN